MLLLGGREVLYVLLISTICRGSWITETKLTTVCTACIIRFDLTKGTVRTCRPTTPGITGIYLLTTVVMIIYPHT